MSHKSGKRICEEIKLLVFEKLSENRSVPEISEMMKISQPTIYKIKAGIESQQRGRKKSYNSENFNFQLKSAVKNIRKSVAKVTAAN